MKTYDLGEDKARFSVVSFNTVATTRVPWSYNAAVINAGIDQMSATGKTSISDGFVAAGKLFADDSRDAKKIVLLLSDGEQTVDAAGTYVKCADDNAECHRSKMQIAIDAAALVKGDDVTVFAWGFGESMSDVWKEGLQQIATEPSKATLVKDLTELTSYLVGLEADVCNQSPLSLPPSPPSCATPIDFALVLDESYSMNRWKGDSMNGWKNDKYPNGTNRREQDEGINFPNHMDGPNGVKALAKKLVRHAAIKPR